MFFELRADYHGLKESTVEGIWMALKNPNPVGPGALGGLPDGRYVAVSVRTVGEGASVRPAKIGTAYLEKVTDGDGVVALSYTNQRGETIPLTTDEWLKKYNVSYFNPIGQQPTATVTKPIGAHPASTSANDAPGRMKVPALPAAGPITVTVTVSIQ